MSKKRLQASGTNDPDDDNWDTQFNHSGDISAFDKYKTLSKLRSLEDINTQDTIPLQEKIVVDNPVNLKNDIHNRKITFQNIKNLFKFKKVCPCFD